MLQRAPGTKLLAQFSLDHTLISPNTPGLTFTHPTSVNYKVHEDTQLKPDCWYLKQMENVEVAECEALAQKFFELFGVGPKTNIVIDEINNIYYIASKLIENYHSLAEYTNTDIQRELRKETLTDLGRIIILALFLNEIDLNISNLGRVYNLLKKIDGDWCFARFQKKLSNTLYKITTGVIAGLPDNTTYAAHNWLGLVYKGNKQTTDSSPPLNQTALITPDMRDQPNIRYEFNCAMLCLLVMSDALLERIVLHIVHPDRAPQFMNELIIRREQIRCAACADASFQTYLTTSQTRNDLAEFMQQLFSFTLSKKIKLVSDTEQAALQNNLELCFNALKLHVAVFKKDIASIKTLLVNRYPCPAQPRMTTPLDTAVSLGCVEIVGILLTSNQFKLLKKNELGFSLLHSAMQPASNIETLHLLMDKLEETGLLSTCLKLINGAGETPLHRAASFGHHIELLLTVLKKYDLTATALQARDKNGLTPLHHAAHYGHVETVLALLAAGADIEAQDSRGFTPVFHAVERGHLEILLQLIKRGTNVRHLSEGGISLLHTAASSPSSNTLAILRQLSALGVDTQVLTSDGKSALHCAAASRNPRVNEIINELIKYGLQVDLPEQDGKTPLHFAADSSSPAKLKAIEALLRHRANASARTKEDDLPLHYAARSWTEDTTKVINVLLKENPQAVTATNKRLETPLHFAAKDGNLLALTALSFYTSNLDCLNQGLTSPLLCAAQYRHSHCVEFLLRRKANVNHKNMAGNTAAHFAASKNDVATLTLLKANKADFLCVNEAGLTALNRAIEAGHIEAIRFFLLETGPFTTSYLNAALFSAMRCRNRCVHSIISLLLENGASLDARNGQDDTLLAYARQQDNPHALAGLLAASNSPAASPLSASPPVSSAALAANAGNPFQAPRPSLAVLAASASVASLTPKK